ncbi:MAG TPA: Fe-Mn family superoxide dismutase [Candidatus Paceibacterota bacterium]
MFQAKTFNIPLVAGISKKTIEEHLKLYAGYVKHANLIQEKIAEYKADSEKNAYVLGELNRRFAFEFDGMRNHEYYFEQLEGGHREAAMDSLLNKQIEKDFGSVKEWFDSFVVLAMTRGIGWAVLWYDPVSKHLVQNWVDEQHLGQLNGLKFIYGIDMWEHSYLMDYTPGEKRKYIDAYTNATNQEVSARRFDEAIK